VREARAENLVIYSSEIFWFSSDKTRPSLRLPYHVSRCEISHLLAGSPRHMHSVLSLILDIYVIVN